MGLVKAPTGPSRGTPPLGGKLPSAPAADCSPRASGRRDRRRPGLRAHLAAARHRRRPAGRGRPHGLAACRGGTVSGTDGGSVTTLMQSRPPGDPPWPIRPQGEDPPSSGPGPWPSTSRECLVAPHRRPHGAATASEALRARPPAPSESLSLTAAGDDALVTELGDALRNASTRSSASPPSSTRSWRPRRRADPDYDGPIQDEAGQTAGASIVCPPHHARRGWPTQ